MLARRFDERGQNQRSVGRAEQRVDGVLRMGHEAHDVAALVADAGDVVDGAVARLAVAQDNLTVRLELAHELGRREPAAVAVLDGDRDALAGRAPRREGQVVALDDKRHVAADEAQALVPEQYAREKPGLAENLEAVA